ncbi:MAG: FAD-dependent oxidoreductase [Muribaculaceae bacterium]|nr:FAD-dependent oxidoreductase [Muribaculaceae bacterium]
MYQQINLQLSPEKAYNELLLKAAVSTQLELDVNRLKRIDILKRSIDARQKNIKINLTLGIHIDEVDNEIIASEFDNIVYKNVDSDSPSVIVVGAGPAGLFASLRLLELGIRPILLERGKDVDSRRIDLAAISREQKVDPDSNYCFGEGGAGAFSDGKLFTRSKKKGPVEKILRILHQHGAPMEILYDAHPHIGTDLLPGVIKSIRQTILSHGGEVHFQTPVEELIIESGKVKGVVTRNGKKYYGKVILATGHSARDTFRMLNEKGVPMEPKGLAVGVRLEHPQELIDCLQYKSRNGRGKYLPAAEYSFLTRVDSRAVYSFCMCPGGIVVPSASGPNQSAVNGMSPSNRGSRWANSGMVVEILPDDIEGENPLKMLEYQEKIEKIFYEASNRTQKAPAQRMEDFVKGRLSKDLESTSYAPGLIPTRVDELLPVEISSRLKKGFVEFDKRRRGFLTNRATVIGAETRTSSPIRLPRDKETMCHVSIEGLYPVGEGAGWAGGIVSAALDGQNAASALWDHYFK